MTTLLSDKSRHSRLWRPATTSPSRAVQPANDPTRHRQRPLCNIAVLGALAALLLLPGCSLTPRGLDRQRAAVARAGAEFRRGPSRAELPLPTDENDWRSLLRRALVANGDVRAAWFEWKAGVEKVSGAAAWPNTNISVGYSYLFSSEGVKGFDRSSFDVGPDSMQNLSFPGKAMASGRIALEEARAAGERFRAAKFAVQRSVLEAWLDLALAAENARLAVESAVLADVGNDAADAVLRAGGEQGGSLRARIASARNDNDAASERANIAGAKATLAALTVMDSPESIPTPTRLPFPRELPTDPSVLWSAASDGPEVKGLQADRRGRAEQKDLATLQWIPDINPYAAVSGSIEQGVGVAIMLPTKIAEIRSGIATARAMRGAAGARLAQARRDQLGELQSRLLAADDAHRARSLLEDRVLPAAAAAGTASEIAYTSGRADLAGLVEARQLALEVRAEIAAAAIERERQLAAIEEILGADLETFTAALPQRAAGIPAQAVAAPAQVVAVPAQSVETFAAHLSSGLASPSREAAKTTPVALVSPQEKLR